MVYELQDTMHLLLLRPVAPQFACRRFRCRRERHIVSFFRYSIDVRART
jgi:hypothetical protein